jgi:hypothetical protein
MERLLAGSESVERDVQALCHGSAYEFHITQ